MTKLIGRTREGFGLAALVMVAALAAAARGDSYTWAGGTSGNWDSSTANWNDGEANVAWAEGTNAVFNNSANTTITVVGDHSASNITEAGTAQVTLAGSGKLSWTGTFRTIGTTSFYNPFTDNGGGLRFDINAHTYFNTANMHTGGTYLKSAVGGGAYAIILRGGGDATFGAVPATRSTNIVIEAGSGSVVFHADSNQDISIHTNRTILIKNGATMYVGSHGKLRVRSNIVGELANGYPTGTRLATYSTYWQNRTYIYGTNYFGRLYVEGDMEIADGHTTLVTSSAGTGENAALYVKGNGTAYNNKKGYLLVSGGKLVNYQGNYRFHINNYGHLDIAGGTVSMTSAEFLNALSSPGKTTIRDGGLLECYQFRLEQTTVGDGGELCLNTNGTLRCRNIWIDFPNSGKGIVHFNGGKLLSTAGNSDVPVILSPTNAKWDNQRFQVEAGGAIFDTSNGHHLLFGRPLVSGVGAGETDGGLTCLLANGRNVVLDSAAGHSYTGPTRVEAVGSGTSARTLQCRTANVLPSTTTLQIGPGAQAGFSDWAATPSDLAQTIARLEGTGRVVSNSLLVVTGAVAPIFDGAYGTLAIEKPCSLSGDYEVAGDANGCGCLKLEASGQDISGLALKVADFEALNEDARVDFYKILDAPNGYSGQFASGNLFGPWHVRHTSTAAYLFCQKGTAITLR